jgi:integrase
MIARANKKERVISKDEFKTIYETAENEVHQLIVLFMYTMGSRIDETLKLDFTRTIILDDENPQYRWFGGQNKANLLGKHALNSSLIEPLKRLRDQRKAEGTDLLFPQKTNIHAALSEQQIEWELWRKRAALGWHWTPHTFRHTCLTNVLNDPRFPQLVVCKQYRVSPQTAAATYVKTKLETMLLLKDAIEVEL